MQACDQWEGFSDRCVLLLDKSQCNKGYADFNELFILEQYEDDSDNHCYWTPIPSDYKQYDL